MFKKVLICVCAMSVFLMSGCINLGGVSQKDYDMAVADRDEEMEAYVSIVEENLELEEEWNTLQDEVDALTEENIALYEELAAARETSVEGMGDAVIHQITDDVALKVYLPEGFTDSGNGVYVVSISDPSNIIIRSEQTNQFGMAFATEEMMEEYLLESYEAQGYDVDGFEISRFERSEIQGYDTLVMETELASQGLNIQQIEVIIQVEDMTCMLVYTTEASLGRYEEFLQSVESIQVGKAK